MSLDAMLPAMAGGVLDVAGIVVVVFFVLLHTGVAVLLVSALPELWRQWDLADEATLAPILESPALPTVSIIVTGRADRLWTAAAVRSLLALRYPRHEVVLVHDGADEGVLRTLVEHFDLYQVPPAILVNVPTGPARGYYRSRRHGKLFVIDKPYQGHADDLNAALNASRFPYVLTMDVHTQLEPDALSRLMRPFLLGEPVAAVVAAMRVGHAAHPPGSRDVLSAVPLGWLGGVQAVEQLRDRVHARVGWNRFGGQPPDRGSVMVHRREQLLELDGYRTAVIDPERDLVARLRERVRGRLATPVPTLPDAVAWSIAPERLRSAAVAHGAIQRRRIDELLRARGAAHDAGGAAGKRVAVVLAAFVMAPVVELLGYLLLAAALLRGGLRDPFVPLFLLAVPGYALVLSLWSVALEWVGVGGVGSWREAARLAAFAVAEQVGYRQRIMWARLGATTRAVLRRPGSEVRLVAGKGMRNTADGVRAR